MDRDEFLAQLDHLTPKEIEERLSSWDTEKLTLAHEYFAKQSKAEPPQTDRLLLGKSANNVVTERTMAAAVIALGLVLAALILRGGYEVAGSNVSLAARLCRRQSPLGGFQTAACNRVGCLRKAVRTIRSTACPRFLTLTVSR